MKTGCRNAEKIEGGNKVYEKNLNTEESVYEVYKRNDKLGFFRFRNVFISFDKQNSAKKVIATQPQLSPEYIQQFIEEYNKGEVKDVEIEMEWTLGNEEDDNQNLIPVLVPKLTNGFITIGKKEPILYTEEEVKSLFIEFNPSLSTLDWFNKNKKK